MQNRLSLLAILFSFCSPVSLSAQDHGFPFGRPLNSEVTMTTYPADTTASAVVLNEFGEAYVDNGGDHNLLFERHIRIKILKKEGLRYADFEILLRKQSGKKELVRAVKASSFTFSQGMVRETKLDSKNVFTEQRNKYYDVQKFAVPAVQVGSVIEVQYTLESPFLYNFRSWEFQSDIPKVQSEYWPTIPANYRYNISLCGFQKLDKNDNELVTNCFAPGGGNTASCARYKFAMKNIPAFKEEEYMTAESNFLSAVNFELEEIHFFDGRKDRITKEWKDVEMELAREESFGLQIKRGTNFIDEHIRPVLEGETDSLKRAQKVYDFIKERFLWNDLYGIFGDLGFRKAFETRTGNVADINLMLISALQHAGLNVEPLILSTRSHGAVKELFPVISDFNYVVAKVNIKGKSYLLDATDDFLPFGLVPERCLNGKGRVLGEKESYWFEVQPAQKKRTTSVYKLKLQDDGKITGTIGINAMGYQAVKQRKQIAKFNTQDDYLKDLQQQWDHIHIERYESQKLDDLNSALSEKFEIQIEGDGQNVQNILFQPFLLDRWEKNPFKLESRLYPVDFGAPLEETVIMTLEYPSGYVLSELPAKVGLALPNNGGRLIFTAQAGENQITLNFSLLIAKSVYTSDEYQYLKELFNSVVQVQDLTLLLKSKTRRTEINR